MYPIGTCDLGNSNYSTGLDPPACNSDYKGLPKVRRTPPACNSGYNKNIRGP